MCSPDCKKLGISAAAAIVLLTGMEYVIHHLLLLSTYQKAHYLGLWNPQMVMKSRMPWMFLAYILFGIVFAKVYTLGYEEDKDALGQGLRYGFWVGLLSPAYGALISYFVYPVSCRLAAAWGVLGLAECLILGTAVALLYRPAPHPQS